MYELLNRVRLSSGEEMEVGVVVAPDAPWRDRILPLLGHKESYFQSHMERALDGQLDGLQTRFYIGSLNGQPISNVLVVGGAGAGIVSHVFTPPEYRQRGASRAVMACQMADMPRAGLSVLTMDAALGHPYRMYASFGFRGLREGTGMMIWEAAPGAATALINRPLGPARPVRWPDWGMMNLLTLLPVGDGEELPRSPLLGINSLGEVEGTFAEMLYRRDLQYWRQPPACLVLGAAGAEEIALGWALLSADERWFDDLLTLDLYVRPGYGDLAEGYSRLLGALPAQPRRIVCASAGDGPRAAALQQAGFTAEAVLPDWLPNGDGRRDVRLFVRQ